MITLNKTLVAATAALIALGGSAQADAHAEFDINAARLDVSLDKNGDGEVSDDEIIDGNMAMFDTDASGAIDASERGMAEEMLMAGGTISDDAMGAQAATLAMVEDFNVQAARLDVSLDKNGDGDITDDEIIDGNMDIFDTDKNGFIDADERGVADQALMN